MHSVCVCVCMRGYLVEEVQKCSIDTRHLTDLTLSSQEHWNFLRLIDVKRSLGMMLSGLVLSPLTHSVEGKTSPVAAILTSEVRK